MRESSWIINRGLIGSFYRSLWYLVQIFISDLSSETLGPACEPVIKAASDLLTKSGVGIYLHIYNLYTVYSQNFFFQIETEFMYKIVLREVISTFFPLTMKFIFICTQMNGNWKMRIDNKFVVPMYKQQYSFYPIFVCRIAWYSIAQFDEILLTWFS